MQQPPVNKSVRIGWKPTAYRQAAVALSLAAGKTTTEAIVNHSGIHTRTVQRVLNEMRALGLVDRHISMLDGKRHSIWYIVDLKAWMRDVVPVAWDLVREHRTRSEAVKETKARRRRK